MCLGRGWSDRYLLLPLLSLPIQWCFILKILTVFDVECINAHVRTLTIMHKHAHTCTHALHSYICVFSLHHVNNFSTNQAYMHRGIFLNMSKSCKYEVGFLLNVKKKCYSYLLRLSLVRVRLLGSSCAKLLNASSLNLFPERFKSFKTYHTKNHERNEMKVCHN